MIKRAILLGFFSIAALACRTSDPHQDVENAQEAQLKSQRKYQEQSAEARKDYTVEDAEAQRKATIAAGEQSTDANEKRLKADAKMTEARTVAMAKANERLQKADAKTDEIRALINTAGAKATPASRDAVRAIEAQRGAAKTSIDQLGSAPDPNFKQADDHADSQLDMLEKYIKQAENEVDKFR